MAREVQKDPLQDLKLAIRSKNPGNLYFFHGEETFLLRHYLGQLHHLILCCFYNKTLKIGFFND